MPLKKIRDVGRLLDDYEQWVEKNIEVSEDDEEELAYLISIRDEMADITMKSSETASFFREAVRLYNKEDYAEAIARFRKCLDRPTNQEDKYLVFYNMAEAYAHLGRFKMSKRYAEHARRIDPSKNAPLYLTAYLLYKVGDYDQAKKKYKKLLRDDQDNPEPYWILGNIARNENKPTESAAMYKKAIKIMKSPDLVLNLIQVLLENGFVDEAKHHWQKYKGDKRIVREVNKFPDMKRVLETTQ